MNSSSITTTHQHHYYPFSARTTSVLYGADLKFKDARSVATRKTFTYSLSPTHMHSIHDQKNRITAALLDCPFVFVESNNTPGCTVDAYALCCDFEANCLSSSSTVSNSSSRPKRGRSTSSGSTVPSSLSTLRSTSFMKKLDDTEQVLLAYQTFLESPRLHSVPEDENFAEEDARNKVLVPLQGTVACYGCRWDEGYMGQLLLESVCNFPSQRFGIPAQATSLCGLLNNDMKEMRIFNMGVQHSSILIVQKPSVLDDGDSLHVFQESSLLSEHQQSSRKGLVCGLQK
jgi:hypothetical protein